MLVANVARLERLQILHFHFAVPFAFTAQQVRERLGADFLHMVGTLHGTDVSQLGTDPLIGPRLAEALECLDALTTVSLSHADLAVRTFGLSVPPRVATPPAPPAIVMTRC